MLDVLELHEYVVKQNKSTHPYKFFMKIKSDIKILTQISII